MCASAIFAAHFVLATVACPLAAADDNTLPLSRRIDAHLTPVSGITPPRCSDAEYLRRVSLDLTGQPPTADQVRTFLSDTAPDKRRQLVTKLVRSPHFARHITHRLDVMLMERRANKQVKQDDWRAWLLKRVQENRPYNQIAREILAADGVDPQARPAARFYLDRDSEPNLIARDIGRIFFGRDLQCAQCHDHPLIDDYLQSDYHGLLAFTAPGYAVSVKQGKANVSVYAEKAGGDLQFESVFEKGTGHRTGPRMPGSVALTEPFYYPGDEYTVAPGNNVRSVPKFSRRARLAEHATGGSNQAFNQNIANRLWSWMFGRGLVHPVDLHHPLNPPSHPQLMRELGEHFAATNFDIRGFLHDLALTDAYQRSIDLPGIATAPPPEGEGESAKERLAQLSSESDKQFANALEAWLTAEQKMLPVATEFDAARKKYADEKKKLDAAAAAAAKATADHQSKLRLRDSLKAAADALSAASSQLEADKEVDSALSQIATRLKTATTEEATTRKAMEAKVAAVKAPKQSTDAARLAVDATRTKLAPLHSEVARLEKTVLAARSAFQQAETTHQAWLAREARQETAAALQHFQQQIAALHQALPELRTQHAAAAARVEQAQIALAQSREQHAAATRASEQARRELTIFTRRTAAVAQMQQAVSSARSAATAVVALADAASLPGALNVLETEAQRWQAAATGPTEALAAAKAAEQAANSQLQAATERLEGITAQHSGAVAEVTRIAAAIEKSTASLAQLSASRNENETRLAEQFTKDFTTASLRPLTPEQLCWSILRVTGVYERYRRNEVAALEKEKPLTDAQRKDAAVLESREREIEQRTFDKLKGLLGTFVSLYGAAAGQPQGDFFATADQALFSANAGTLNGWVVPSGDNVTERIMKQTDAGRAAEELYLAVLSRMPAPEETAAVREYLDGRKDDRRQAAQELVWSLITSVEFRFNH